MNMRIMTPLALLLLGICIGCEAAEGDQAASSAQIEQVAIGMTRDSVLAVWGPGLLFPKEPQDIPRVLRGYRLQTFGVGSEQVQVLWYREVRGTVDEAITEALETPVVLQADTVIAVGWKQLEAVSARLNIPNPIK